MKKVLLTTCNAKYIHKNLALRWLYTTAPHKECVTIQEYTIKEHEEQIAKDILSRQPEVVCFSCYIWNIQLIRRVILLLKQQKSDLHILVGGPEVSYESFDLLDAGVDAISIGEGEQSVWEYISMLDQAQAYEIAGIYTRQFPNTEYRKTELAWLERFEAPYFMEMDAPGMDRQYFYLETSRGCPYGCTYCLSSADREVRMFSIEYIMGILERLKDSRVTQVKLLDRTFNADPKRALQIARYMNEHCTHQIFQFEIVAETLSEELLQFFCEEAVPGRFRFEIGVQSFHTQTLHSVGRIQNNERLKEVIQRLKASGALMHVDLIAGLPYEDLSSFQMSFDSLFSLQASELQLGILKLLKGTKLRSQRERYHFVFQETAPYDVTASAWLKKEEMRRIHACAEAVEKFWNSGACRSVITAILELHWYESAFALFMDLGQEYERLPRPYQPYELFRCFYPLLKKQDERLVDAILLTQYYRNFKQKPHRFARPWVTLEKKKELLAFALKQGIANQDILFRYGVADIGYHKEAGYQLVLYNRNQQYPRQWFINEEMTEIKEMTR